MSQAAKRLEQMRSNPKKGWNIQDIKVVCDGHGVELRSPTSGSHYKVRHISQRSFTIPFARPIKPVYVRQFVAYIDAVKAQP